MTKSDALLSGVQWSTSNLAFFSVSLHFDVLDPAQSARVLLVYFFDFSILSAAQRTTSCCCATPEHALQCRNISLAVGHCVLSHKAAAFECVCVCVPVCVCVGVCVCLHREKERERSAQFWGSLAARHCSAAAALPASVNICRCRHTDLRSCRWSHQSEARPALP